MQALDFIFLGKNRASYTAGKRLGGQCNRDFPGTARFFRGDPSPYPIDLWIAGHTHLYQVSPAAPNWRFPMIVLGGGSKKYYQGAAFYFKVNARGITFEVIDTAGQTHARFRLAASGKPPVLEPVE